MEWSTTVAGNLGNLNLDSLFAKMDEVFANVDHVRKLWTKFDSLVQTGSVQSYVSAHRYLRLQLGATLTEEQAMFKFVNGLKPMIRKDVLLARPATLTKAEVVAVRSEQANIAVAARVEQVVNK